MPARHRFRVAAVRRTVQTVVADEGFARLARARSARFPEGAVIAVVALYRVQFRPRVDGHRRLANLAGIVGLGLVSRHTPASYEAASRDLVRALAGAGNTTVLGARQVVVAGVLGPWSALAVLAEVVRGAPIAVIARAGVERRPTCLGRERPADLTGVAGILVIDADADASDEAATSRVVQAVTSIGVA